MKEIGKERKIAIAALIIAVLMLTVAFAAMSRTLKINGTAKVDSAAWDIHFKSAKMTDKKGDAREAVAPVIDNGGIDLTLKVGLRKPKDEITYEAVIENSGDIDAEIESIEYPNLTDDQAKIIEFVATYQNGDEISKSQEINAKEEKIVEIVIRYKDINDESLLAKESYDIPLTFKINYVQKGGLLFDTESTPGGDDVIIDSETESSPFKVTKDGTLIYYERQGNETSVTVPAEVNGIKIKSIAPYAFLDNAELMVFPEKGYAIGLTSELEEIGPGLASAIGVNFLTIDEYLNNPPFGFKLDPSDDKDYIVSAVDLNTEEVLVELGVDSHYLTDIDLSNMLYLEEIQKNAFSGIMGEGVEECGVNDRCSLGKLQTVKLPENGVFKTIGENAFENNQISEIIMPSTVTSIDFYAFYRNKLTNLTIPASVETIGNHAFMNNPLENVTVLGESTDRFDSVWNTRFGSATKIEG